MGSNNSGCSGGKGHKNEKEGKGHKNEKEGKGHQNEKEGKKGTRWKYR